MCWCSPETISGFSCGMPECKPPATERHLMLIKKLTAGLEQLGKNLDQLCKRVDKIEMVMDLTEPVTQDDIDALSKEEMSQADIKLCKTCEKPLNKTSYVIKRDAFGEYLICHKCYLKLQLNA